MIRNSTTKISSETQLRMTFRMHKIMKKYIVIWWVFLLRDVSETTLNLLRVCVLLPIGFTYMVQLFERNYFGKLFLLSRRSLDAAAICRWMGNELLSVDSHANQPGRPAARREFRRRAAWKRGERVYEKKTLLLYKLRQLQLVIGCVFLLFF